MYAALSYYQHKEAASAERCEPLYSHAEYRLQYHRLRVNRFLKLLVYATLSY
jgi:hypothetical protein